MEARAKRSSFFLGATIVRVLEETWSLGLCALSGLELTSAATDTQAPLGTVALVV